MAEQVREQAGGQSVAVRVNHIAAAGLVPIALTSSGRVVADGSGLAAWPDGAMVRVMSDDALPAQAATASLPAGCVPAATGAGQVVSTCPGLPQLTDATTLATRPLPGTGWSRFVGATNANGEADFPAGIGTRWLAAEASGGKGNSIGLIDWRTGRWWDDAPFPRRGQVLDLDRPGAVANVCRPVCVGVRRVQGAGAVRRRDRPDPVWTSGRWTARARTLGDASGRCTSKILSPADAGAGRSTAMTWSPRRAHACSCLATDPGRGMSTCAARAPRLRPCA